MHLTFSVHYTRIFSVLTRRNNDKKKEHDAAMANCDTLFLHTSPLPPNVSRYLGEQVHGYALRCTPTRHMNPPKTYEKHEPRLAEHPQHTLRHRVFSDTTNPTPQTNSDRHITKYAPGKPFPKSHRWDELPGGTCTHFFTAPHVARSSHMDPSLPTPRRK